MRVQSHSTVENILRRLTVREVSFAWGVAVHRLDRHHWSVAGGEALLLLPAMDALMQVAGFVPLPGADDVDERRIWGVEGALVSDRG